MEVILLQNKNVLSKALLKQEMLSPQADLKKKTLIECYQKCCQYCSLYILQSGEKKIAVSGQEPRKKKNISLFSSNLTSSQ